MAIGITGVTSVNAVQKCATDCSSLCANEWDYGKDYSDYYNDTHAHRSSVKVGSDNWGYSGNDSRDYNASAGKWLYASVNKHWYESHKGSYYDNKDCNSAGPKSWVK